MEEKDDELQTDFGATSWPALHWLHWLVWHPWSSTCSRETLLKHNPQFVAGKHSLFGDHESEDILTILL